MNLGLLGLLGEESDLSKGHDESLTLKDFLKEKSEFFSLKQKKYKLFSSKKDQFGTEVLWFKKKQEANNKDTVKLYFPFMGSLLRKTNEVCGYCETGNYLYHQVLFRNKTIHIQITCNFCHRFIKYSPKES